MSPLNVSAKNFHYYKFTRILQKDPELLNLLLE